MRCRCFIGFWLQSKGTEDKKVKMRGPANFQISFLALNNVNRACKVYSHHRWSSLRPKMSHSAICFDSAQDCKNLRVDRKLKNEPVNDFHCLHKCIDLANIIFYPGLDIRVSPFSNVNFTWRGEPSYIKFTLLNGQTRISNPG